MTGPTPDRLARYTGGPRCSRRPRRLPRGRRPGPEHELTHVPDAGYRVAPMPAAPWPSATATWSSASTGGLPREVVRGEVVRRASDEAQRLLAAGEHLPGDLGGGGEPWCRGSPPRRGARSRWRPRRWRPGLDELLVLATEGSAPGGSRYRLPKSSSRTRTGTPRNAPIGGWPSGNPTASWRVARTRIAGGFSRTSPSSPCLRAGGRSRSTTSSSIPTWMNPSRPPSVPDDAQRSVVGPDQLEWLPRRSGAAPRPGRGRPRWCGWPRAVLVAGSPRRPPDPSPSDDIPATVGG